MSLNLPNAFPKKLDLTPPKYKKEKKTYVPIHVHSSFSTYDGCSTIKELVEVADSLGMHAISLSDHGTMSGVFSFVQECKERKIKPIVGCELYINENRRAEKKDASNEHLCLFAMDIRGYKNLLKIMYDAATNGFYYRPRTDLNFIEENSKGLICTTACLSSPIIKPSLEGNDEKAIKNLKKLKRIFDDRLYIEFNFNEMDVQKEANSKLKKLAKKYRVKGVYGLDVHYTYKEDVWVQDILKLNQRKTTIHDSNWKDYVFSARRLFLKPYKIALKEPKLLGYDDFNLKYVESLLEATNEIADRVNFDLEFGVHAPYYTYKGKRVNAKKFLKTLINRFFMKKIEQKIISKDKKQIYKKRMEYEYNLIVECKYCNYFLIIWDMVKNSRNKGIFRGIGRGSAAGCLISFLLDITGVDPIKYGLLFERFMDIQRKDPPDIDLDWEHERGEEIEDYLRKKYGEKKVAHVCTYSWWRTKSSIGEVFKTTGEKIEDIFKLKKMIRFDEGDNRDSKNVDAALKYVRENFNDKTVMDMLNRQKKIGIPIVKRLVNNIKNVGMHPGGVVVSPKPIFNYIPVVRHKDNILTGFSQGSDGRTELEWIGLIKIDNLRVKAVTVVKETLRLIKERRGIDLFEGIWNINVEEKEVYKYYQEGKTEGVFQVESEEINAFMKRLKPECFDDLRAIVALFRPGSLASGEADKFIKRKHDEEKVLYVHPILKKYVGSTYGCFVYQEQIMNIMNELCGFPRSKTMRYMKLMKKVYDTSDKRIIGVVNKMKKGLIKLSKFTKEQADKLCDVMLESYNYIFNKSHSTSYALFSYQMMWLKYHYPLEFFCALLSKTENKRTEHKGGKIDIKIKKYISGAKKIGINVLPPKFGKSQQEFIIENDNVLRAGTNVVVGLGKSGDELYKVKSRKNGKYYIEDMVECKDISWARLNKRKVETLISIGFFDGCVKVIKKVTNKQLMYAWKKFNERKKKKGDVKLFIECLRESIKEVEGKFKKREQIAFQIQAFRFFFSKHPLDSKRLRKVIERYNNDVSKSTLKIKDVNSMNKSKNNRGTIIGYINEIRITKPRRGPSAGEKMAIVGIEDSKDKAKILIWPEFYSIDRYKKILVEGNIGIFRVKRKYSNDEDESSTWELLSVGNRAHLISDKDLKKIVSKRG